VANSPAVGFTQTDYDMDGIGDPYDSEVDGDSWSNSAETTIGTDPGDPCPENWPADINNDTFVDVIGDISTVGGQFGNKAPPASARYDVVPDPPDGLIDVIGDISRMAGLFGQSCGVLYGTATGSP
jgi:hypothetical protein